MLSWYNEAMEKEKFTREQIIAEAKRQYGKPVCLDRINEAQKEPTLQEAVDMIIINTAYWEM